MLNIFKKFLDYNQREINKIKLKVDEVNKLEDWARKLSLKEIKDQTEEFKSEVKDNKKTLDELLPQAFALVRETSRRILGQRHFDVQLIAGLALHQGKIAEQRTGEGKTLSATTSIYLNALSGK